LLASLSPVVALNASAAQSDTLTCDDFTNQDAAQIVLDLDDTYEDTLDEDGDGEACPDLPARDESGGGDDVDVELAIGTDVSDFEDAVGDPDDDADADDFTIGTVYDGFGDFDSVAVFWLNDTAAHIQVQLADELPEDDAYDLALDLLPADADADTQADELEGGELLYAGTSNDIADIFTDADYEDYEVGGEAGDVRIILIPGESDIATIDVAIGAGDEFVSTGGADPSGDSTDDPDADAEEYLQTVRDSADQMLTDITDFTTLLTSGEELTDAQLTQIQDILDRWATAEDEAKALDAPADYQDIQDTYEDAATALTDASTNITIYINEQDDDALSQGFDSLTEALTLTTELDALLTDAGV
jgi:hypothetical protein